MTDVDSLVEELTLDEKIGLVHGDVDPEGKATGYLPGVERLGIPPLRLVDGPLGIRAEGESATAFPASLALASSWDPSLAREQGVVQGREAKAYGQDVVLGPGINIIRVPECGRNFEYYTEDPYLNARLATENVAGIQSEDVIASVKHYVANNQETNRYYVDAQIGERALREIYLPAFRAAVEDAGAKSVMTAYNQVNGTHMSDHARLVSEVLKGEYGFEGFVVSDWWGTESTVGAANAGLDLEMPGQPFAKFPNEGYDFDGADPADVEIPDILPDMHEGGFFSDPLREAIESGEVSEATLDEKVRRILRTMDSIGLFEDAQRDGALDTHEHRELARRIAVEGSVLLTNDDALPLDESNSIALVGPNADDTKKGGGSSEVTPFAETTPLYALRERACEFTFERGVPRIEESSLFDAFETDDGDGEAEAGEPDDASLEDAVAAAVRADATVLVLQDDATECEDRDDLGLPGGQDELVSAVAAVAEQTVVVLRTSGPVEMPWLDEVDAVIEMWYPGQADGDALADMLYGDAEPGGRLPITFGRAAEDYPAHAEETFPGIDDEVKYDEGIFVGYRHFDEQEVEPLFPFGHGLSYGEFEYGDATVDAVETTETVESADGGVTVTVPIRNVGERAGTETVQVYVRKRNVPIAVPDRELAGFAKVSLDPGEGEDVSVEIDQEAFAYYHDETGWTIPDGPHELLIGRSSRDIRTTVEVALEVDH